MAKGTEILVSLVWQTDRQSNHQVSYSIIVIVGPTFSVCEFTTSAEC